jgi:hypothetical protein
MTRIRIYANPNSSIVEFDVIAAVGVGLSTRITSPTAKLAGKSFSAVPNGAADHTAYGSIDGGRADSSTDCRSNRCVGALQRAQRVSHSSADIAALCGAATKVRKGL